MQLNQLKQDLHQFKNPDKAKVHARFFKTGKGEYGEGDKFLRIKVPDQRKVSKKYKNLSLNDLQKLLHSKIHEYRLTALFILVIQYQKADENQKAKIVNFYLKNTKNVNNWDLVDSSAHYILGEWLIDKDKSILYTFAKSENLWERRIAMMTTYYFIKQKQFEDTLKIAEILLKDKHDLIHKAVGWMLREIGNRDQATEEKFLKKFYKKMPRTMLRYAIEKFEENKRQSYLKR